MIGFALILTLLIGFLIFKNVSVETDGARKVNSTPTPLQSEEQNRRKTSIAVNQKNRASTLALEDSLSDLRASLQSSPNKAHRQKILQAWYEKMLLTGGDPELIQTIEAWLINGSDFETEIEFRPGPDSQLSSWNSGRILMMDLLSQLSPSKAAQLAWQWIETSTSSAEKVLALKILAVSELSNSKNREYWIRAVEDLYTNIPTGVPDHAVLYGFDLFVYSGQSRLLKILFPLSEQNESKALAHGAALALKRFSQSYPIQTLEYLSHDLERTRKTPEMIARLLSHVDPGQLEQVKLLESILAFGSEKSLPLDRFFVEFPNFNREFSYNLLSENKLPSMDSIHKADIIALQLVEEWISKGRFPEYHSQLELLKFRLKKNTNSSIH